MKRRLAVAIVSVVALSPLALPAHAARSVERSYLHNPVISIAVCDPASPLAPVNAGACVDLEEGETTVSVVIDDDSGNAVAANLSFYAPLENDQPVFDDGETRVPPRRVELVSTLVFCQSVSGVAVPEGAISLSVHLRDLADEVLADELGEGSVCPTPASPTSGTITVGLS